MEAHFSCSPSEVWPLRDTWLVESLPNLPTVTSKNEHAGDRIAELLQGHGY